MFLRCSSPLLGSCEYLSLAVCLTIAVILHLLFIIRSEQVLGGTEFDLLLLVAQFRPGWYVALIGKCSVCMSPVALAVSNGGKRVLG